MPVNAKDLNIEIQEIKEILQNTSSTEVLQKARNTIVKATLSNGEIVVIKAFKKPHFINKIMYKYIRPSKAKRSFQYAEKLLTLGIETPKPLAFYEEFDSIGLTQSFYVSEFVEANLTFRELVEVPDYPEHEIILREFTKFCYDLHQKGVEFKDHSPGNTLIKKSGEDYIFYLVDLNRMQFHEKMNFKQRMYNLRRLTPKKDMVETMSKEYAQLAGLPYEMVFTELWQQTEKFQKKYHNKQKWKKLLKGK